MTVCFFVLSIVAHAALLSLIFHLATPSHTQPHAAEWMMLSLLDAPSAMPQQDDCARSTSRGSHIIIDIITPCFGDGARAACYRH